MPARFRVAVAVLGAAALLAGCSGADDDPTAVATPSATASAGEEAEAATGVEPTPTGAPSDPAATQRAEESPTASGRSSASSSPGQPPTQSPDQSEPSEPASVEPAPTADPTGEANASESEYRTADGEPAGPAPDGVISSCALGTLVVGMQSDAAELTGLVDRLLAADGPSGFIFRSSSDVFVAGTEADGIIGFLVKTDAWQTPEGIRVGSAMADLAGAYGAAVQELTTDIGHPYALVRDGDCGYFFSPDPFGPSDGPIITIISGAWDAISEAQPGTSFG